MTRWGVAPDQAGVVLRWARVADDQVGVAPDQVGVVLEVGKGGSEPGWGTPRGGGGWLGTAPAHFGARWGRLGTRGKEVWGGVNGVREVAGGAKGGGE